MMCSLSNYVLSTLICTLQVLGATATESVNLSQSQVGPQGEGRFIVPTNQVLSPTGKQIYFPIRANDLCVSTDNRFVAVLGHRSILMLDADTGKILDATGYTSVPHLTSGGSYKGIRFTPDNQRVLVSNIAGVLECFQVNENGVLYNRNPIVLGQPEEALVPSGFCFSEDGERVYLALCVSNEIAEVNLATRSIIRKIKTGSMPFDVVRKDQLLYVSNFGGAIPSATDTTGPAGRGTDVRVDPIRFIANHGTVSVIDLESATETAQIDVGLHPSGMTLTPDGQFLIVANANSDTLSLIDVTTQQLVEDFLVKPEPSLLFGSSPNAVVMNNEGNRLYVSNGTNNAVCVVEFSPETPPFVPGIPLSHFRIEGYIPTGWYPAGLALSPDGKKLWVANVKGVGSRSEDPLIKPTWQGIKGLDFPPIGHPERQGGFNTHDQTGSVSMITIPDAWQLEEYSRVVMENNRMTESMSALAPPRQGIEPKPLPERHGEPSVFEHVVYIIKENRTYDQVFGDMPEGNGHEPFCHFPEEVTPNHHKLAREFILLDNFYCSGILSADGHQWTNEAFVTSYLEKAFGGFPRSYPYWGGDSLAYAGSGFIWDNVLAHGKTFRTYGEFIKATVRWKDPSRTGEPRFIDCYQDYVEGKGEIEIIGTPSIASLLPHCCTKTIGFPSIVSDQYRAQVFIDELKQFEANGNFPNLSMILIPNDHTSGTRPGMPTPRASVADNDLALGRIVEAISKSKFWEKTCIFVVQDDPQAGIDHVDGHRTVAFVISPYTKRKQVISTHYNQTGMVRSIELILGLPPMNQFDSSAIPMSDCFVDEPDLSPYEVLPNQIPLDELNLELSQIDDPIQAYWAKKSLELPLDDIDEAPEDVFNRIIWHACKGYELPYPGDAVVRLVE